MTNREINLAAIWCAVGVFVGGSIVAVAEHAEHEDFNECSALQDAIKKHGATDAEMTVYNLGNGKPWTQWIVGEGEFPPDKSTKCRGCGLIMKPVRVSHPAAPELACPQCGYPSEAILDKDNPR